MVANTHANREDRQAGEDAAKNREIAVSKVHPPSLESVSKSYLAVLSQEFAVI